MWFSASTDSVSLGAYSFFAFFIVQNKLHKNKDKYKVSNKNIFLSFPQDKKGHHNIQKILVELFYSCVLV